jgi:hypothetical protein
MSDRQRIDKGIMQKKAQLEDNKKLLLTQEPFLHQKAISSTILGYIQNGYKRISLDSNP